MFYTGAAPNQQAIPAVDYLMSDEGGAVKRWVLEGTDYVYPRTTNKILEAYLKSKGVAAEDIMINYTPFGFSDWQTEVAAIKKFGSAGKKTAVVSTINGDANVPFYKELGNQGIKATDIPVVAFSVGEEELAGIDTAPLVGHLAAWNYFQSIDTPENEDFIKKWHAFIKNDKRTTNDPMEATYIGFNMWVKAVEKAGTTDPDAVIDALIGVSVPNLTGGFSTMMPNHHITKPVYIGEIQDNGQFDVVWQTPGLVVGDEWSDYLPDSKDLISDWRAPMSCGNFNVATGKCGGVLIAAPTRHGSCLIRADDRRRALPASSRSERSADRPIEAADWPDRQNWYCRPCARPVRSSPSVLAALAALREPLPAGLMPTISQAAGQCAGPGDYDAARSGDRRRSPQPAIRPPRRSSTRSRTAISMSASPMAPSSRRSEAGSDYTLTDPATGTDAGTAGRSRCRQDPRQQQAARS